MNSIDILRNYRHDISGKFKDITSAINTLDEKSFSDPEGIEILLAVHEVVLKMLRTSRRTMSENIEKNIMLIVVNDFNGNDLTKISFDEITIRCIHTDSSIMYVYSESENQGPLDEDIKVLKKLLPFNEHKKMGRKELDSEILKFKG